MKWDPDPPAPSPCPGAGRGFWRHYLYHTTKLPLGVWLVSPAFGGLAYVMSLAIPWMWAFAIAALGVGITVAMWPEGQESEDDTQP